MNHYLSLSINNFSFVFYTVHTLFTVWRFLIFLKEVFLLTALIWSKTLKTVISWNSIRIKKIASKYIFPKFFLFFFCFRKMKSDFISLLTIIVHLFQRLLRTLKDVLSYCMQWSWMTTQYATLKTVFGKVMALCEISKEKGQKFSFRSYREYLWRSFLKIFLCVSVKESMTERSQKQWLLWTKYANERRGEFKWVNANVLSDISALTGSVYHMHVEIKSTRRNVRENCDVETKGYRTGKIV